MRSTNTSTLENQKLNSLKNYLLENKSHLNSNIYLKIENANSAGEIWCILFKNDLISLYVSLKEQGMVPTQDELNEVHENRNSWLYLAASDNRIHIFQALLKANILPSDEALALCDKKNNINIWGMLARSENRIHIFLELLALNFSPSVEALEICDNKYNAHTWLVLACDDKRIPVFQELLKLNIVPTKAALSVCNNQNNMNTWFALSIGRIRIHVFQELIKRGVLPESSDLEILTKSKMNAWYELARQYAGITLFIALLNLNILPSREALEVRSTRFNMDAWVWLMRPKSGPVVRKLFDLDILPHSEIESSNVQIQNRIDEFRKQLRNGMNSTNKMAIALTRNNQADFYGFLYFFYAMTENKITDLHLLPEVLLLIGRFILPHTLKNENLNSEQNRSAFLKHMTIKSLDTYIDSWSFFHTHGDRARSLRQAIVETDDPGKVLRTQFHMSRHPHKFIPNAVRYLDKHETSFSKVSSDEDFNAILKHGFVIK